MSTYTYTARSADDPDVVVTFTLDDHHMRVDLGAALEHVGRALIPEEEEGEEARKSRLQPVLKPLAVSLIEQKTKPFHISDIDASAKGEGLRLAAWVRVGGLRLAPVMFAMKRVDNPEAAHAFVEELDRRKASAEPRQKLRGPFDYWASWFLVGFFAALAGVLLTRKKEKMEA